MPPISLQKLIDAKLAKAKIDPDDAREVLSVVNADAKLTPAQLTQLQRLAALPASRFEKKDEFLPNPRDRAAGVTIKADPKRWIESRLELGTEPNSSRAELNPKGDPAGAARRAPRARRR